MSCDAKQNMLLTAPGRAIAFTTTQCVASVARVVRVVRVVRADCMVLELRFNATRNKKVVIHIKRCGFLDRSTGYCHCKSVRLVTDAISVGP